jgi:transcriptional regulator with XRE-family HTH domain
MAGTEAVGHERGRDWLSTTLRDLRRRAGLSGMDAAGQAGLSQPRISRIETGRFVPTEAEIRSLCRLYQAPADVRRELLQVVDDLRSETAAARVVLQRGAWRLQQRLGRIEAAAARLRAYQPAVVLGLLQTADYARAVFADGGDITGEALDQAVAERAARAAVLDSDRDFTLIMAEGALRWQAGGPRLMAAQLDHIAEVTHRANVRIGVIPWIRPVQVFPLHGFHIYDQRAAIVGTRTATAFITDPRDVSDYEKLFAELEALASFDDDARRVISRIAGDYRDLA